MCKSLGEVAQGFAAAPDLLCIKPEVVCVGEHLFQGEAGFFDAAGLGEALDVPERAEAEASFRTGETVGSRRLRRCSGLRACRR